MMRQALLLAGAAMTLGAAAPNDTLRMALVDVEGGAATLWVTPEGHSLLVDTGWPKGMGGPRPAPGAPPPLATTSSAERIRAAARALGVSRIDTLLITHYHLDHVGGVPDLLGAMPVGTVVDHGPNRETPPPDATPAQRATATVALYQTYLAAIGDRKHIVMRPGETLRIDGLVLTAVDSDREVIGKPLPGGGKPGTGCDRASTKDRDGGEENPRSLGFVATWGKARIVALGDTTWNIENRLACPVDLIGPVDLMVGTHHGSELSNSPVLLDTIAPRVVLVPNGAVKGGDAASFDAAMASPRIEGLWQLHYATRSGPDRNAPADQIANPADGVDAAYPLQVAVMRSGAITVTNPRNGFARSYPAR